jgi:ferredoxin
MKTHQLERITGAVKNSLGCVYGLNKAKMHIKYPNPESFGKMLVDLNRYLKVRLHIMDGITAMEGNGPMSGDSVQMNCILISTDPVALDTVFCRIIGLDPYLVPTNKFGEEFGLGKACESDIEILGDGISGLVNHKYKVDRSVKKTHSGGANKLAAKRPVIIKGKCKRCGLCIESCPVEGKALRFPNGDHAKVPIYDYDKCIRCYCCQELCPEKAISVKTPFLGRIF